MLYSYLSRYVCHKMCSTRHRSGQCDNILTETSPRAKLNFATGMLHAMWHSFARTGHLFQLGQNDLTLHFLRVYYGSHISRMRRNCQYPRARGVYSPTTPILASHLSTRDEREEREDFVCWVYWKFHFTPQRSDTAPKQGYKT